TDDRIVTVGFSAASYTGGNSSIVLTRYLASNGLLDTGFGTSGRANTGLSMSASDYNMQVALLSGQHILTGDRVTGTSDSDMALARYTDAGTPDTTFGTGGTVITDLGGNDDAAHAFAITSTGAIFVAGASNARGTDDFTL